MSRDELSVCESDIRLDGKVALVTGSTSGIGFEAAKNLAKRGAKVIISGRNPAKLDSAKNEISQATGSQNLVTRQVEFESLASIRNFASETVKAEPRLDILINNVGAVGLEDRLTADDLHAMMQVNYFGTFLLTFLLFPLLKSSAPSRVVNVSSIASLIGHIDFETWNKIGENSNWALYCNAKLAVTLFTEEMDKRIKGSGVNVYSVDPGMARSKIVTNFTRDPQLNRLLYLTFQTLGRPLDRAAMIPVYLATESKFESKSGKHFRDCKEFFSSWFSKDTVLKQSLWEESKKLVKITTEEDWELRVW